MAQLYVPSRRIIDPIKFIKWCWPKVTLYDKQKEIVYSVWENRETIVPAGNMLGKDFIAGLIALTFFLTRRRARVVTTSVDQSQLEKVLWGEIGNFIQECPHELPLKINYLDIRKYVNGDLDKKSYMIGRVAATVEGLLGHHLPWGTGREPTTLMIYDEASGISNEYKTRTDTWSHRVLVIGNPYECENFFKHAVKGTSDGIDSGGDIEGPNRKYFYRKIIQIKAEHSPNVRLAQAEIAAGREPSNEILVPGVLSYEDYLHRRATWDPIKQSISLDAEFYEGQETKLYPPTWLDAAVKKHLSLKGLKRTAKSMGVDPAEGGDDTCWTIVDEHGILLQLAEKTPDTSVITKKTIGLMNTYKLKAEDVIFDAGGGGKIHADNLRAKGYNVRAVGFGESSSNVNPIPNSTKARTEEKEQRYIYPNRRCEMYGTLRELLDPNFNPDGFAIPLECSELLRQLRPIPLLYDNEGRLYLPPKNKRDPRSNRLTMQDLVGCSPDEADSAVMAVWGMKNKPKSPYVGAIVISEAT